MNLKTIRVLIATIIAAALLTPLEAFGGDRGGADGGGSGDIPQSSAYQVKQAINGVMKTRLINAFYNLAYARDQVEDAYIKRILNTLYDRALEDSDWESKQPIIREIKNAQFSIKEDDGCVGPDGKKHAASVPEFKRSSPICFSVPFLRLIPHQDLETQVLALAAHEFAHIFGFGEFESTIFQTFFLHHGKSLAEVESKLMLRLNATKVLQFTEGEKLSTIVFQGGKILDQRSARIADDSEPVCVIRVLLGSKSFDHYLKTNKVPHLGTQQITLDLMHRESSVHCSGDLCGVTHLTYMINPLFNGFGYDGTGSRLHDSSGKVTDDKIVSLSCRAKNLRTMDMKRAMGEFVQTPHIIKVK